MTPGDAVATVYLSILSSPGKLGLYEKLAAGPDIYPDLHSEADIRVQEHLTGIYGNNPVKAAELIVERCIKKSVQIIGYRDKRYPPLLREIHRPPLAIYVKGNISHEKMISIVGTRKSDRVSEDITVRISSTLAGLGFSIVSGMAYGIDRFAHLGALDSGGATVGILPGGIDGIYPYRNRDIYEMIEKSEKSCIISEYPPGIPSGQKWTFAQRNRIISGLSSSLIVIQAPIDSGAMITAKYGIEQNRELFVCPGNAFDERYRGCHELIRDGAVLVSGMEDILREIVPDFSETGQQPEEKAPVYETESPQVQKPLVLTSIKDVDLSGYNGIERDILQSIGDGGTDIDIFTRKFSYTAEEVNRVITGLEIEGIIVRKGNNICLA